jgi:hypothetical protein
MNNVSRTFSLSEAKIQAQILLKNINPNHGELSKEALAKIQQYLNRHNINLALPDLQLKHCLAYIAYVYGFASWANLKFYFERTKLTKFTPRGGFFNQWFSNYNEAKAILLKAGGYLLPYKNHFFICERGYIDYVGLDPEDSHWDKIGNNWVEPINITAWEELEQKYLIINR